MDHRIPTRFHRQRSKSRTVDFDVGDPEVIEQSSFEIEEITLAGEHEVVVETEIVTDITITGEHRAVES